MDDEKLTFSQPNGSPNQQPPSPSSPANHPTLTTTLDPHAHFCALLGIPHPSNTKLTPPATSGPILSSGPSTEPLYPRLMSHLNRQKREYLFTASLSNTLLLSQILIGSIVTALSAVNVHHITVTVFGALNTVIAGLIAYMKSRGQPMRARAFRDELEHCLYLMEDGEGMVWGMCREQGWVGADGSSGGTAGKEVGERGAAEHAPMTPEEWKDFIRDEVDKLATLYEEACDTARRNYPDLYIKGNDPAVGKAKNRRPPPRSGSVKGDNTAKKEGVEKSVHSRSASRAHEG